MSKNIIKNIFLDQDCVLASFFEASLHKLNKKYRKDNPITISEYVDYGKFDMAAGFGITNAEFWQCVEGGDQYFWDNLPLFPWSKDFYDFLSRFAPVTILSSPSDGANCVWGKVQWLKKKIDPNISTGDCVFTKKKYLLANSESLLIDDLQKNCDEFIAAGGQAVCVPSTWNTKNLSYNDILEKILRDSPLGK
jgi:5'(3')-deoxyribonucleotidase